MIELKHHLCKDNTEHTLIEINVFNLYIIIIIQTHLALVILCDSPYNYFTHTNSLFNHQN